MKAAMFDVKGKKVGTVDLPKQFAEEFRPDLIKRAHEVIEANNRTPYGAFPDAGTRSSAKLSRRRRKYRGSYGHGISRVPRKHVWQRGMQFGWVGAFAPGMVGGRKAHPPKPSKIWSKKINIYERRKAIRSALAATVIAEHVRGRGHKFQDLAPVLETKVEELAKTKDVRDLFLSLQLQEEMTRIGERKVRAGKGTMRGRKYKTKKGPLLVVAKACPLEKAASNVLGIDICQVQDLNVSLLAPGGVPGRFTIFSEEAMKRIADEKLFMTKKNRDKKEEKKEKPEVKKAARKTVKKTTKKVTKK